MSNASLPMPESLPAQRARPGALALAVVLAVALHAALLLGWYGLTQQLRAGSALGSMSTRLIAAAPQPAPAAPETQAQPQTPAPPSPPKPAPRPTPKPKPRPAKPAPSQANPTPPSAPPQTARGVEGGSTSPFASLLDAAPIADFGGGRASTPDQPLLDDTAATEARAFGLKGDAPPATVPRGATLGYRATGTLAGKPVAAGSTLSWRRNDTQYEADWDSPAPALAPARLGSAGLLASQGLVPVQAGPRAGGASPARFDYAARTVQFAPPAPAATLQAGTQDALSALVQLGSWVAGDPKAFQPGKTFEMPLASAGAVRPWRWFVEAEEPAGTLRGTPVQALKLTHVPLGEDSGNAPKIELWLAAALDYLPARMRLTWPNGDVLDQVVDTANLNRTAPPPPNGKP